MPVRVYSNESRVELFLNGLSLGSKTVRDVTAAWDVEFAPGENVLSARSAVREDEVTIDYEHRGSLFDEGSLPGEKLAVNAGGAEQIIGRDGLVWEADRSYVQGSWGHIGGTGERSHHRIFGTDDDPLYQTRRLGSHRYRFDVPDGSYLVELHFAHLADAPSGKSGFRADVNGMALDVRGLEPYTQREIEIPAAASGGNGLTIHLIGESGDAHIDAFINGIAVQRTGAR
jgi:beta-galactosidase